MGWGLSGWWADGFLVEKNPKFGMATSSRNSGVIHSGIYYPKNSWKAKLCVAGNRLTKEFCVRHNVPHRTTGKLVVAKDAGEEAELLALKKKGEENGVTGLRLIGAGELRGEEACEIRGARADLIRNLAYPVPHHDQLTLGVHFTKTLWGTTLVGPTATYVDGKENYERGRMAVAEFAEDAKTMLPEIEERDLQLGY